MTRSAPQTDADKPNWSYRIGAAVIAVVVLVIGSLVLSASLPRWWALRIGDMAGGSITRGTAWGLFFGFLSTLFPLLLGLFAATRRGRGAKFLIVGSLFAAFVIATPNVMTLWIAKGTSNAAHAGQRILDTEATGFRGASAFGAMVGAAIFLTVLVFYVRYRRRGEQLSEQREATERAKQDTERAKQDTERAKQDAEEARTQARLARTKDPEPQSPPGEHQ